MSQRELIVLGTGSQVPTKQRNHNGYLVRWGREGLLFDPGDDDDLVLGGHGDMARLSDCMAQAPHDRQRDFQQRAYRCLRHAEGEQFVREHVSGTVLGKRDESLVFEHLQHAEQLAESRQLDVQQWAHRFGRPIARRMSCSCIQQSKMRTCMNRA